VSCQERPEGDSHAIIAGVKAAETVTIGDTGVAVSRVGLGTAPLGGLYTPVAEAEAAAVVRRTLDLGLRFVDTAPYYGYGLSEERTGHGLAGVPRDSFTLSTKVGRLLREGGTQDRAGSEPFWKEERPVGYVWDYSSDGVRRSLEESLERLGLERVDILLVHDPEEHVAEALGACEAVCALRDEGLIGAAGVGMNEPLVPFVRETGVDCILLAGRYTLLDQSSLTEFLPLCAERGVAVIVGGVFNSGILADPGPGAMFDYESAMPGVVERAQRLKAVCSRHAVPLAAAALRFPFGHQAVAAVLAGSRSVRELEANVRLFEHDVPAALWAELKAEALLPEDAPPP
jgi:D-threo-aldose 1-dehydrogenase